jgi:hypothetical protein
LPITRLDVNLASWRSKAGNVIPSQGELIIEQSRLSTTKICRL